MESQGRTEVELQIRMARSESVAGRGRMENRCANKNMYSDVYKITVYRIESKKGAPTPMFLNG